MYYFLYLLKNITFLLFQRFNFPALTRQRPVQFQQIQIQQRIFLLQPQTFSLQTLDFHRQIRPPFTGVPLFAFLAPRPHLPPFNGGRGAAPRKGFLLPVADGPVRLQPLRAGVGADIGDQQKSEQKN